MSIIYLFLDGVGLGDNDPDRNPYSRYAHSFLSAAGGKTGNTPGNWTVVETDASLGYPGLPQSATGQTALWTGVNGARAMGRHMTGFPGPTLIRVIERYSIIKRLCEAGLRCSLMNAYTHSYIERIQQRPRLASASTHVQRVSGQRLKTVDDLEQNDALYMDITHEIMHQIYPDLAERFPTQSARQRGADFARIASNYDLCLFEFFLTDKAGHEQSFEMCAWCIQVLEEFLDGLCAAMDPQRDLLVIASDHGNSEDLSVKTHTHRAVPTFLFGNGAEAGAKSIRSLIDIPPFLYSQLGLPDGSPEESHRRSAELAAESSLSLSPPGTSAGGLPPSG